MEPVSPRWRTNQIRAGWEEEGKPGFLEAETEKSQGAQRSLRWGCVPHPYCAPCSRARGTGCWLPPQLLAAPSDASLGTGSIWGGGGSQVTHIWDGKPEPPALVLELEPSPNWKSQFL